MTEYDAVLFDMDGVILSQGNGDWWPLVEQAVDGSLAEHGIEDTHPAYDPLFDRMFELFTGQVNDVAERETVIAEIAAVSQGTSEVYRGEPVANHRDLWRTHGELSADIQKAQVDGLERTYYDDVSVIDEIYGDVALGVMSNNNHDFVEYVMDHPDLADAVGMEGTLDAYMETCYGIGRDVNEHRRRKPEPDYLEQAASDINAANPLYVGDSRCDIAAAENAGMDSVFIRRDHRKNYELNGHDPVTELTSLEELPDIVGYGEL